MPAGLDAPAAARRALSAARCQIARALRAGAACCPRCRCGQCSAVCPVGAITERSEWREVMQELESKRKVGCTARWAMKCGDVKQCAKGMGWGVR